MRFISTKSRANDFARQMILQSKRTVTNEVVKHNNMGKGKCGSYKQKQRLMSLLSTRTNPYDVLSTRTNANDIGKHNNKGKRG
jgi:hypothetical protein